MLEDKINDNEVYIIKKENKDLLQETKLNFYNIGDYIVVTPNEIEELTK